MRFVAHVQHLYNTRPRNITRQQIMRDTGISNTWLDRFPRIEPETTRLTADNLQKLYEYLTRDTQRLNF